MSDHETLSVIRDVLAYNGTFPSLPGELVERLRRIASASPWRPIAEADKDIAYIHDLGELRIGNSYPIWARDEDGRVFEALWSDDGKRSYWWDIEGESPVDPVEFMPHPLDPRFADANEPTGGEP